VRLAGKLLVPLQSYIQCISMKMLYSIRVSVKYINLHLMLIGLIAEIVEHLFHMNLSGRETSSSVSLLERWMNQTCFHLKNTSFIVSELNGMTQPTSSLVFLTSQKPEMSQIALGQVNSTLGSKQALTMYNEAYSDGFIYANSA